LFRRQIAIPQDHGSWVFLFSPLAIGIAAGAAIDQATIFFCVAAIAAFLMRQPLTVLIKVHAGRRPSSDLSAAFFWASVYGLIALLALFALFLLGYGYIAYLAIPGIPIFAWHLWLVSRRAERKQVLVEVAATGVLSLVAPAAYWLGSGHYDAFGWWLWLLTWIQSAASIVYAYLRLEQRGWDSIPARRERFRAGLPALAFTSGNLILSVLLGAVAGLLPSLLFIPYLSQWLETLWGIDHPAAGWKPTRIGIRQLIVSTLWTVLFIVTWQMG
jgi:hypothetical protein